jgi:hypothetical protein
MCYHRHTSPPLSPPACTHHSSDTTAVSIGGPCADCTRVVCVVLQSRPEHHAQMELHGPAGCRFAARGTHFHVEAHATESRWPGLAQVATFWVCQLIQGAASAELNATAQINCAALNKPIMRTAWFSLKNVHDKDTLMLATTRALATRGAQCKVGTKQTIQEQAT